MSTNQTSETKIPANLQLVRCATSNNQLPPLLLINTFFLINLLSMVRLARRENLPFLSSLIFSRKFARTARGKCTFPQRLTSPSIRNTLLWYVLDEVKHICIYSCGSMGRPPGGGGGGGLKFYYYPPLFIPSPPPILTIWCLYLRCCDLHLS